MANILLVGAGKLGSRHLQAMRGFAEPHSIYVIEPSEGSRLAAKEIYDNTEGQDNNVVFLSSLDEMTGTTESVDVAIVATGSANRRAIVEELVSRLDIKAMILEKVLFQRVRDIEEVGKLIEEKGIKTWVNCPRRYFDHYKEIKEELDKTDSFQVSVSGSDWGMGCNGIHFIDIISFLAGSTDVEIDISGLDDDIIESKREGYCEITGTIRGCVGKCSDFTITSYRSGDMPASVIITGNRSKHMVFEWVGERIMVTAEDGVSKKKAETIYQSQLTNRQVEDILRNGMCEIPSYDESAKLHTAFMRPLSGYFRDRGIEDDICPIT